MVSFKQLAKITCFTVKNQGINNILNTRDNQGFAFIEIAVKPTVLTVGYKAHLK